MIVDLLWEEFKQIVTDKGLVRFNDRDSFYLIQFSNFITSVLKDSGSDHSDFEENYKPYANTYKASEVVTQQEKPDKDLVLASIEGPFSGNACALQIKIPGEAGNLQSRLVAGGYAFTDVFGWGDRITKVSVLDKDYVYAGVAYSATPLEAGIPGANEETTWADIFPDGTPLGSFIDEECDEGFHGWRLWCEDGNQGGIDIDPIGGYGSLPGAAYLTVVIEKTETSGATKAAVNIWWGKKNA